MISKDTQKRAVSAVSCDQYCFKKLYKGEKKSNYGVDVKKPSQGKASLSRSYSAGDPVKGRKLFPTNLSLNLDKQLTDFDQLLSHHDQKLASRLNDQYLKDEWEFKKEKLSNKSKFREATVVCGDSREQAAKFQKQSYRSLRTEVTKSEKMVYCTKSGFVRERPVTAPNLSRYSKREEIEFKRRQSVAAQNALVSKLQWLLKQSEQRDKNDKVVVDTSDRPVVDDFKLTQHPRVVTETELDDTEKRWADLMFDIETEAGRYEIAMETEMDYYIPGYKGKMEEKKQAACPQPPTKKKVKSAAHKPEYEDLMSALAYPTRRIPPSHARKCDARKTLEKLQNMFRGWYGARSQKGPHYILMSPYFHNSPKGQLFSKLAKMSDEEVKKIHGEFLYRYTKTSQIDQRPVTAPAVLTVEECQAVAKGNLSRTSRVSSGYGSMDENEDRCGSPVAQAREVTVLSPTGSKEDHVGTTVEEKVEIEELHDFDSSDSVATSVSEKIKVMMQEKDNTVAGGDHPRSQSAYQHRHEHMLNEQMPVKGQNGPRSISAYGDRYPESSVDEIAPTPYMQHSKPKTVSVGSIGKISLLESISEAKFWEDFAVKEIEEKKQKSHDILVLNHEDSGGKLENADHESGYGDTAEHSSHNLNNKIEIIQDQKTNEGEGDVLEILLQEGSKKKKKKSRQPAYKPGQFSSGIKAPRAFQPSRDVRKDKFIEMDTKRHQRVNNGLSCVKSGNHSQSKPDDSSMSNKKSRLINLKFRESTPVKLSVNKVSQMDKENNDKELDDETEPNKDIANVRQRSSDCNRKIRVSENKPNKYDRLVQRMGEDISKRLATRLLSV